MTTYIFAIPATLCVGVQAKTRHEAVALAQQVLDRTGRIDDLYLSGPETESAYVWPSGNPVTEEHILSSVRREEEDSTHV